MKPQWKSEIRSRLADLQLEPPREAAIVEELAQYLDDHYVELLARLNRKPIPKHLLNCTTVSY
jgi:hypothetical protein